MPLRIAEPKPEKEKGAPEDVHRKRPGASNVMFKAALIVTRPAGGFGGRRGLSRLLTNFLWTPRVVPQFEIRAGLYSLPPLATQF